MRQWHVPVAGAAKAGTRYVLLLTIGFYLGWTDGGGVTLLGALLFLPYVFLAPLVIGTYSIRDARSSAR
jgi:hypothetical protein